MTRSYGFYVDTTEHLLTALTQVLDATDGTAPVPGCPDWTADDLAEHCVGVLGFFTTQLAAADPTSPTATPDAVLAEPLDVLSTQLITDLRLVGETHPCWNWSGVNLTASWFARRAANEFAVHHADAVAASGGSPTMPADIAADGIDELLDVFLDPDPDAPFDGVGVIHLDTNDGPGWMIEVGEGARRSDESPVASATGDVDQVLLSLWGRPARVTFDGDPGVMNRWREIASFE